jgi:hypothetical protein
MDPLTRPQRDALLASPSWITRAALPPPEVVDRLGKALAALPDAVAARLFEQLSVEPERVRTLLSAVEMARSVGCRVVEAGDGCIVLEPREGPRFALAALFYPVARHPAGHPDDVARLTGVLDATFQGRQYALYLRRGVPAGFDPSAVNRAVHLWLTAIDRGEWKGRHAIYEDEHVALELTLVQQRPDAPEGRVMTVGPIDSLERLAMVDADVTELAGTRRVEAPDMPLVVALGAQPRWRLPRGYVEQLLYGTADHTEAARGSEGPAYRATFRAGERSLFSDGSAHMLGALWWIEGSGPDPFAFRAWSHDNPWSPALPAVPNVEIDRFLAADVLTERKVLSWYRRPTRDWRIA